MRVSVATLLILAVACIPPLPAIPGAFCGDGTVDEGEACDDGNSENGDGCHVDCTEPVCGDGFTDIDEACDDGNAVDDDGCSACALDVDAPAVCGDGIVNGAEACDFAATPDACNNDCTDGVCGDGKIDGDEACDDGNATAGDGCTDCAIDGGGPVCGDGIINGAETCDFAATPDACNNDCTDGVCGDGKIDGDEACDDNNATDGDGCTACAVDVPPGPRCGDGVVDGGEDCDFGLTPDDCNTDCSASTCSDGIVGPDEECDEGGNNGEAAIAGLDGVALDSTFEVTTLLVLGATPTQGWTAVTGSSRIIDSLGGSGVITGTDGFANYEVQYEAGAAVQPDTSYTLTLDMGFVAGGFTGTTATFQLQLGTLNGGTFTAIGTKVGNVTNIGNLVTGPTVSSHAVLTIETGAVVSGDPLAVRWAQTNNPGPNDFFGIDNVLLSSRSRCTQGCSFCGNRVVSAGEDCDGTVGCSAACTTIAPRSLVATGGASQTNILDVGDINGDTIPDIVAGALTGGAYAVLIGLGGGAFAPAQAVASASEPRGLRLADVNRDGALDIVGASDVDVIIHLNNGNGGFGAASLIPVGNTEFVEVVDLNRDGSLDVVTGRSNNALTILPGNGDGTFQAAQTIALTGDSRWIVPTDINRDGILDLVVSSLLVGNLAVLIGNGDFTFTELGNATSVANNRRPSLADFNGDGHLDVAVGQQGAAFFDLFFGNGDGTLQAAVEVPGFFTETGDSKAADMNGDGRVDLVMTDEGTDEVGVLLGNGDGSFSAPILFPGNGATIEVADLDQDSVLDFVFASTADSTVKLVPSADSP